MDDSKFWLALWLGLGSLVSAVLITTIISDNAMRVDRSRQAAAMLAAGKTQGEIACAVWDKCVGRITQSVLLSENMDREKRDK